MKSNKSSNAGAPAITLVELCERNREIDRFAAAYVRFDALMSAQLLELEHRFRCYLTPKAKREKLGRK